MSRLATLLMGACFLLTACADPKDPATWIKKLRNPEHATQAVRELQNIGNPVAIKPLADLYKDFESPTILKAIISLAKKDPTNKDAVQALVSALNFTDQEKYHNATLAAAALADLGAKDAVQPLAQLADKTLPIKSRANLARLAAIKALGQLKDKAAIPSLISVLDRRPEDQDFMLNKQAAVALGDLGAAEAVPSLIRALFMQSTIQGTSYPQARVALVKIGKPAVQPLVNAMQGKDEALNKLSKELSFEDGVVMGKISRVLGDMLAADAVPVLLEQLSKAQLGENYTKGIDGPIEALGRIADARAADPLIKLLGDKKADYKLRIQACQALTVLGNKKALPVLLEVAEKGEVEGGYTNLREAAAMAYSRIVGAEASAGMAKIESMIKDPKLAEYKATIDLFKEAQDRMKIAVECKDDVACYGKKVNDRALSLAQREKAGIMIGILPDGRKALDDLIKALPEREPVLRLYYLVSAKRLGNSKDAELVKLVEQLAAKDSKRKVSFLGADLASEDEVALAVLKNKGG